MLRESRAAFASLILALPPALREAAADGDSGPPANGGRWPLGHLQACYDRLVEVASTEDDPEVRQIVQQARHLKRRIDRARNALIVANLGLVVHVARKSDASRIPITDLIQEGSIGLMEAVDRFEPGRGFRFATYAIWWIRRAVNMALADKSRMIRLPHYVGEQIRTLTAVSSKLRDASGLQPTPREIAREMDLPVEKVSRLLTTARDARSLEGFGTTDGAPGPIDFLPDRTAVDPLERTLDHELKQRIDTALKLLSPREEEVLRLRYGLGHGRSYTLREIGRLLDLSRERVRQIEHAALEKLKPALGERHPHTGAAGRPGGSPRPRKSRRRGSSGPPGGARDAPPIRGSMADEGHPFSSPA